MEEDNRSPADLARAARGAAASLRAWSAETQANWRRSAFREGTAEFLEELAAALDTPEVLNSLVALKRLLRHLEVPGHLGEGE